MSNLAKVLRDNWDKLPPNGADLSRATDEQKKALMNILEFMSPPQPMKLDELFDA